MSQHKITVDHPGTHNPTRAQMSEALTKVLSDGGLRRKANADFTVKEFSVTSGGPSEYTLEIDTEPSAKTETPKVEKA